MLFNTLYFVSLPVGQVKPKSNLSEAISACLGQALFSNPALRHFMVPTGGSWLSKWQAIKAFHKGVELRHGCVLFLFFFIVYMNWIDKCNQADEFATIGN